MTKNNAVNLIKEMNLPVPVYDALIEIVADLNYESFAAGYDKGYDDGWTEAMNECW